MEKDEPDLIELYAHVCQQFNAPRVHVLTDLFELKLDLYTYYLTTVYNHHMEVKQAEFKKNNITDEDTFKIYY